jgi:hypothetical protein
MLGCEVPSKYYLHYNVCFKYLNNFFFRMTCAPAAQKMEPATQRKTEFFLTLPGVPLGVGLCLI